MTTNRAMELLYDSEASLRLVDHELDALREFTAGVQETVGPTASAAGPVGAPGSPVDSLPLLEPAPPADPEFPELLGAASGLALVPGILQRANAEIVNVLASLRQCRSALESATTDKLQITHEKIREVTSATEVAATDILDGLDRAQGLIDELDAEAAAHATRSEREGELRGRLRDELFMITGSLQFQDITTQQLSHAASVLVDMEARLAEIAILFDPRRYGAPEIPYAPPAPPPIFAPDATIANAEERQAVADEIFTGERDG